MAKTAAEEASAFGLSEHSRYDQHPYIAVTAKLSDGRNPKWRAGDTCGTIMYSCFAMVLFLLGMFVMLWPTQPEVKIVDIQLNHVNGSDVGDGGTFYDFPAMALDLRVQVQNRDFFGRDYSSVVMLIERQGKLQGNTTRSGMSVEARSTSLLELNTQFELSQLDNEGALRSSISLTVAVEVGGVVEYVFFHVLVKGSTSCAVSFDAEKETLNCQECCYKRT